MPPRTARKCTPHLPQGFIEALCEDAMMETFPASASAVYTEAFHRRRLRIVDQTDYATSADDFVDPVPLYGAEAASGARRTALHHAAANADPIAVCELIRLRATVNVKDSAGDTPLTVAMDAYCGVYPDTKNEPSPNSVHTKCTLGDWCRRQKFIIGTLLEQHADVTSVRDGNTYLHQACAMGDWDLISLFLRHGATSSNRKGRRPIDFFESEDDRARYRELIRKHPADRPRPPRTCPCWSGKPQSECHRVKKPLPYPSHFYCICGSKRAHANCCGRKGLGIVEVWDDSVGAIRTLYSYIWDEERIGQIMVNKQTLAEEKAAAAASASGRVKRKKVEDEKSKQSTMKYVEELTERGVVDPAFAFALKQVGDLPRSGKNVDPRLAEITQLEWNGFVDDYIRSGVDSRPAHEIERTSKIALNGGALYRQCEGPDCTVWESSDVSLRVCSRCKIAMYCSSECQRSAWKDHKAVCGTKNQSSVKTLPSQISLGTTVLSDLGDLMSTLKTKLQDLQGIKGKERSFAEFYE